MVVLDTLCTSKRQVTFLSFTSWYNSNIHCSFCSNECCFLIKLTVLRLAAAAGGMGKLRYQIDFLISNKVGLLSVHSSLLHPCILFGFIPLFTLFSFKENTTDIYDPKNPISFWQPKLVEKYCYQGKNDRAIWQEETWQVFAVNIEILPLYNTFKQRQWKLVYAGKSVTKLMSPKTLFWVDSCNY